MHAIQRAHGPEVVLLAPQQIRARFPWLDTTGIALGSLGLRGEGWFDGPALHQSQLSRARRQGARLLHDRVLGWECGTARVEAVQLQSGGRLAADRVVLAAGAWSGELAALAGIALPIEASRRTVFVLSTPAALPGCPLIQ